MLQFMRQVSIGAGRSDLLTYLGQSIREAWNPKLPMDEPDKTACRFQQTFAV